MKKSICESSPSDSDVPVQIMLREDSQIDFATGNVFCTFLSDPHLPA